MVGAILAAFVASPAWAACDISADAIPRGYIDYREAFAVLRAQQAEDIAFARANNTVVTEGPWEGIPAQQVAYVGIDECGRRVPLPAISQAWRFGPRLIAGVVGGRGEGTTWVVMPKGDVIVQRVSLGRRLPGMLIGRPHGRAPVQSEGLIDGRDYYFRSRGDHWSFQVGGADVMSDPDWYYEERFGVWPDAGTLTQDQAHSFIAKAAALYRSGMPTMVMDDE